ncbi:MAG: bifunctional aminodeoxychorismate synthase component I/aminodeoxychorismate lyase [Polynucleobacter sp. 24-46-87]|jgi:para-aminobenzoate synthetase/4-amino-4-deoxychorismate lyase|uniref:bifunctional chorismate-binding protein/class IV aminotransferase n=1 Tax=Polynucleobacter sp. 35-46-11 TaxID=1970425 RepID=UPI000BC97AA7|nr:bifunctional chorismate-binding protein/class IV aminotransferase [Polynucleobacter sp. 35-46-11]OYY21617.1 MAG: bifunctional aminodeoxychorismate synthase component I/aminodeoxychorismate lyase [Polynucleobacter sp. 35-46-11]OZA14645.1 MAG: bifunctional aminodeoxychorismate synthase component I/aminodeoxychorismate lyase [Polynucleobacter sp. 24-46-87]
MILLDDAQSSHAAPSSRLYEKVLQCWTIYPQTKSSETIAAVDECLKSINMALARGEYVVAAFAYELGLYIHQIERRPAEEMKLHPLVQAWSFKSYESLSKEDVDKFIRNRIAALEPDSQISGVASLNFSIDEEQFTSDIEIIQEYIRNGDTYQINHTFRISGESYGDPLALYARLRSRQPGRFGAFISEDSSCILSQSPELFIQKQGNTLKAMPMKGTASALSDSAEHLSADAKNQAENVMIVDLLRNDLSRLSLPGTVTVPHLFEVARYGDVLQMTSTVQAEMKPGIQLQDVLNAVFPCGSVTGAPKKRSMEIIQELEPQDRGYYCGALGWIDPSGDFAFSVPIRTLEINQDTKTHASPFTLGIGAGITIDSEANQEWEECQIKAAFLTKLPSELGLFETILVRQGKAQHLELHLSRLMNSALALHIPCSVTELIQSVEIGCEKCTGDTEYRLRLDLDHAGKPSCQIAAITPIQSSVKIFWASDILPDPKKGILHSGNILLRHKVNSRNLYDQAWKLAEGLGGFDALFINEQGYVTEGGRSSIFIKSGDRWLTPPISAGLLPGVMRSIVLSDPQWNAHEANLTIEDVRGAKEIMLSNALRGLIPAHF